MNPYLWVAGSILFGIGILGLLLTHFGIIYGFMVVSPLFFAAAATMYVVAIGLRHPIGIVATFLTTGVLFELIVYFNWLGLGSVL